MKKYNEMTTQEKGCFGCGSIIAIFFFAIVIAVLVGGDEDKKTTEKKESFEDAILWNLSMDKWTFVSKIAIRLPDEIEKTMPAFVEKTSPYRDEKQAERENAVADKFNVHRTPLDGAFYLITRRCLAMSFNEAKDITVTGKTAEDIKFRENLLNAPQAELEQLKKTSLGEIIGNRILTISSNFYKKGNKKVAEAYANCWAIWNMSSDEYNAGKSPYNVYRDAIDLNKQQQKKDEQTYNDLIYR